MLPERGEHARQVSLAIPSAVAANAPLDPHERDAEEQQGDEVRDHVRAATVGGGLTRKPKEVAETDRITRHGENETDTTTPGFVRAGVGRGQACSDWWERESDSGYAVRAALRRP